MQGIDPKLAQESARVDNNAFEFQVEVTDAEDINMNTNDGDEDQ